MKKIFKTFSIVLVGEMPEIIAGVLKRIRDDIDKFVDNKTKDYENI